MAGEGGGVPGLGFSATVGPLLQVFSQLPLVLPWMYPISYFGYVGLKDSVNVDNKAGDPTDSMKGCKGQLKIVRVIV